MDTITGYPQRDEGDETPVSTAEAGALTAKERQRAEFERYVHRAEIDAQTREEPA